MSRRAGVRNKAFHETRKALLGRLTRAVVDAGSAMTSFNELSTFSGVSRATLRHYFDSREGVIAALIEHWATFEPAERVETLAGDRLEALEARVHHLVDGWERGLGTFFELGLQPAINEPFIGPAFVSHFLEPLLQGFEVAITDLQADGVLAAGNPRHASIELVSPVVMALLHQRSLGGARCRFLDVPEFVRAHFRRFVKAWLPERS